MKSLVLLTALLLLGRQPHPAPTLEPEVFSIVDFGISKRLMLTEASVDGQKGMFLFDTGASHLTLNQNRFPGKKIVENAGETTNIIENGVALKATKVGQFQWGNIVREKMFCPVADLSVLEKQLGYPILGLIGFDIIKDYVVEINYVDQIITLKTVSTSKQLNAARPDHSLDFNLCGHIPVLETDVGMKQKVYLGLDSGASINVLDKSWHKQAALHALRQDKLNFTGAAAGSKQADYMVFKEMIIDGVLTLTTPGLLLTDFEIPTGRCLRVDGLIGIDAFTCKRVEIDYPNAKMHIWLGAGVATADGCF
ncbi:MAG: retropepsin-like aspartic protease [Saprospiraceae bacterium]|nr:retropepsin-like aspartic protease [Saprospiraceae bacterium]